MPANKIALTALILAVDLALLPVWFRIFADAAVFADPVRAVFGVATMVMLIASAAHTIRVIWTSEEP